MSDKWILYFWNHVTRRYLSRRDLIVKVAHIFGLWAVWNWVCFLRYKCNSEKTHAVGNILFRATQLEFYKKDIGIWASAFLICFSLSQIPGDHIVFLNTKVRKWPLTAESIIFVPWGSFLQLHLSIMVLQFIWIITWAGHLQKLISFFYSFRL